MHFFRNRRGRDIIIINNQNMSFGEVRNHKVDEHKTENIRDVGKIIIDATIANIDIAPTETSEAEIHYYGQAKTDSDSIEFDVKKNNDQIRINARLQGNCYDSNLKLEIKLPQKVYELIFIKTSSGQIDLAEGVFSQILNINSMSGNIESSATFSRSFMKTLSGNLNVNIYAQSEIDLEMSSVTGNASIALKNTDSINLFTNTAMGNVKNLYQRMIRGYAATVNVNTVCGNIEIR